MRGLRWTIRTLGINLFGGWLIRGWWRLIGVSWAPRTHAILQAIIEGVNHQHRTSFSPHLIICTFRLLSSEVLASFLVTVLLFVAFSAIHHLDYDLNHFRGIQAAVVGHHEWCTPTLTAKRGRRPHLQDPDEAKHEDLLLICILECDTS